MTPRRSRWWVNLLLASWVLPGLAAGAVTATVEPRVIDELETARLTIRVTGTNQPETLQLDALQADFEVLTTQSASQYRSVNGQVESWVEYQVLVRPLGAGELTIPSIRVGGENTPPLRLQVRGIQAELRDAIDRMVFFETELTVNPVYVQAQTVLIRRLFYSSGAQIYSDLPGMPEVPNAVVVPLGETSSTTTVRDGQRYGVIEQRFAILPEQSGSLTVPAIAVTSSVRLQSGGRTRRSGVRITTEPLTINVLPIPPDYPSDAPWLPADDVTLTDQWTPSHGDVAVGDPLSRTLSAQVAGNVSSVIPPLVPALPDQQFRRYPEPPSLTDETRGGTVRGLRQQTYAIIPTVPGRVTLPPTELVWWDVGAHTVQIARTPARTLIVTGSAPQPGVTGGVAQSAAEASPERASEADVRREQVPWPGPARRRALAWTALAILVLVPALMWLLRRRTIHSALPQHASDSGGNAPALSRRASWKQVKTACHSPDPAQLQHALMDYLRSYYRTGTLEATRRFRAAGHGALLERINAARYRPESATAVSGDEVLDALRTLRGGRRRRTPDALPALYD